MKKLFRLKGRDSLLGGVCAGFAEYLEIDVTIMRIIFILSLFVFVFTPVFFYIIMLFVMPVKEETYARVEP